MEIIDHKHTFNIGEQEIELTINCKKGYWTHEITKGQTGMSGSSGGEYKTLKDYIDEEEKSHRYAYNFFNHGYTHAKSEHMNSMDK